MENKSNSLNRIKRQQREKVLRFSIRKYSFGAASVAVAALMFLGARVASADSLVDKTSQLNAGVVNPKNEAELPKESPDTTEEKVDAENQALTSTVNNAPTVDKAKLKKVVEELNVLLSTKLNLDESVVSPVKDRLQKGKEALESSELAQKDIDELVELLSKDVTVVSAAKEATEVQVDKQADKTEKPADNLASQTSPEVSASEESQTVSAKKDTLKVSVDQLQAAVLELPEHETSKEVLEKANELLGLAQGVLENTTVSLNDVEDMTKRVKRMFNSVKNATTRLTSGARDSRNGKSMGEGAQFRATTVEYGRVENALINVKEYISEAKGQGATTIGDRDRTISKTFMTAKYSEEGGKKFITYDVYFQNDGKALDGVTNNTFWFYPPRDILYNSGNNYPVGTIYESYYERYTNNRGTGTLSDNPNHFTKVGDTYNIPLKSYKYQDSGARRSWNDRNLLYQLDGGPGRDNQRQEMLKNLKDNSELNGIIKSNGSYPGGSYSHILTISSHQNYAYKYHVKMRLRDNVTTAEAQKAGSMAVTTKAGSATNATAGYVYAGLGTRVVSQPDAPLDPIKGLTVTKTVGDALGNPDDPVNSGYVRHKDGKPFPSGMTWSWKDGVKPTSTAQAGVFKYTSVATYKDGTKSTDANSGSDGTVTVIVKPKQPTITTDVANKKGLTNQQITVNVGSGVKDGSTVKLYDGDRVIGTGVTKGQTATVTVKEALPGKPITAETIVNNGGTVTSVRSNPVTPTEAPDTQPPTLAISPANQTVVEGDKVTFTVTAKDNKVVNIDGSDFLKKYGTRITSGNATNTNVKTTDSEKVTTITITTSKEDVGKTNTITFNASDNAGNKAKPVTFTFNVTPRDTQKPEATLNGVRLTENANAPIFTVYRGATFNPELKVWDNSGVISKVTTGNLPYGITASTFTAQTGKTEKTPYTTRLSSGTVLNTQTLGDHIGTLHVEGSSATDSRDLKFKYRVVDIESKNLENGVAKVPVGSTLNVANSGKNIDAHNYLKVVDSKDLADRGNNYLPSGMTWTWKQGDNLDPGTTLDNSGKYTRNATAIFPSSVSDVNSTTRKTFAPVEIKRPVVLAVTPTAPSVVGNENGSVTITPPTRPNSTNPQDIDTITLTYTPTGKTSPETVTVTKSGNTWTATVNGKPTDKVSVTPAGVVTIPDSEVADKTEVTAKVSKRIDNNLTLESPVAKDTTKNSKPQTPVATAKDNGDVTGKPQDPAKVDKITVSYIGEDNQPKTAVGKKDPKGNWTVDKPEVQINPNTGEITIPADKVKDLTEVTVVTKNGDGADSDSAKAVARDTQKPQATLNGVTLTETANSPIFTVYRGAEFNPELKVWDNSGTISKVTVGNLPYGVTASNFTAQTGKDGSSEDKKYKTRLSSGTVVNTQTLGEHIGTLHVEGSSATDSRDLKFKYRVVDIETRNLENGIAKVPVASTLNVANSGKNIDAHRYLKVVDSEDKADRGNNYLPSGMTWTWKAGDKLDSGTTLDNSGKYTRNATAVFPDTSKNSITDVNSTTRTTFAPAEIKRQVVLAVTPTVPSIVGNSDGSVTITPPTRPNSTNPQDIDTITLTYVPTGKTTPETVTVTKSGNTWTATVNGKPTDKVSVTPAGVVTIPDSEVADKTEVTAKVSKRIDNNLTLESPVARGTANGPLAAEVTNPAPVPEKAPITPVTVVTPNKPGSIITTDKPVNGLTVDEEGKLKGTPSVTDWGPKEEERIVEIPVKVKNGGETVTVKVPVPILRDTDGDGIPDKEDSDDDNDGIPDTEDANPKVADKLTGTVTGKTVPEKTPVPANTKVVTPNKPGTTITTDKPVNGLTVDNGGNLVGTPKVDNWEPKEEERTVEIPVKLKKGIEEVVVKVPVKIQRDTDGDGIPDVKDPDDDNDGIPDTEDANPKVVDKLTGIVTEKTVPEKTPVPANTKVITPNKPGTTITTDKPVNGLTVDNGGNLVGTPTVDNWEPKEEERTVEIPVKLKKGTEEVVVKVPVKIQRDTDGDGIPDVKDPDDDNDGIPDEEEITNGTDPKTPTTQTPTIDITQQPNGNAIVTPKKPDGKPYPPGTKVEIPGENGTPITVTIGDNGSGEVPNDNLPKKAVPGTGTVTEPNKNPSKPVDVTTPAHKTPKLELDQDPKTGDVTVAPKKPDGSPFPSGTKVEIPGKDKDHPITVTIGEDGKGKVPNSELPEGKVPGTGKITEPGKPTEEVPVETPGKITPGAPTTEQPVDIEITRKPNGDAVVTPKKEDGKPYPPGTKVEIPGEDKDGNPITITVTIGDNGSGEVPNDNLPKKAVPGTGTVTEPNKNPSQPVPVTTPARKTPTLDVEQDPKTGDVTVTPKKPDGSTYPPGTKVEIPGKDKDHPITVTIGEDGKGKVPNSELPEGRVPGKGKITEPGRPTEEVPVETPAHKTPTLDVEQDPKTGDVTVTPKKPDGSTYPPGTKVEIPGKDKDGNPTTITVTIDDNGKGKVPNSELPEGKVPGIGKITEPGRPTEEVPNVTTPAHKTPTLDVEQDPKTGDVTVTPKRPDGSTYPPGTKVEIPGKDKDHPITVTIGEDGKGKVPNSELPEGKVPGTGKITEPGRPTEEVPNVTTPAHKTPTLDVERDPKTGDVTVTPKKPDGSTFPPGTKVEIPGENGP
ncbi:YSIRK-type signal peptide-containing protein, partial [Streptococcus mitis]|uniref:YSIRK-type signal peptide-containing protein n=1 Tax=Streptococcus mitis TaxID=28037 RepID=UPI0039C35C24